MVRLDSGAGCRITGAPWRFLDERRRFDKEWLRGIDNRRTGFSLRQDVVLEVVVVVRGLQQVDWHVRGCRSQSLRKMAGSDAEVQGVRLPACRVSEALIVDAIRSQLLRWFQERCTR